MNRTKPPVPSADPPHPVKRILLTLLSAVLCVLIFPKSGLWPLAWVGLIPLFFAVSGGSGKSAFLLGWFFGAVHAIGVGYWVFYALYFNSSAGLIVSLLFMLAIIGGAIGLYFAFFCWGTFWVLNFRMPSLLKILVIASLWVTLEFGRARFLSGIPWAFLGHSQYPWLSLIQVADITGVYGISWLLVLSNISLFFAVKTRSKRLKPMAFLTLPVFLIFICLVYGSIRISHFTSLGAQPDTTQTTGSISIAVVQISVSQEDKWDRNKWRDILSTLLDLSEKALTQGADLVVWPETTVPFYLEQKIPFEVITLFNKYRATLVTGGPRYTGTPGNYRFYNSVYQIKNGDILNVYNKIKLLPFGEYFPLGFIDVLNLRYAAPRQYSPGNVPVIFNDPAGRFGALICFEVLFPELTRNLVTHGANFIVNLSNDAWFGRTSEHYQHFSMAVFRAVECRRPVVRSSNTGISGLIDVTGRIHGPIEPFKQDVRTFSPVCVNETSFYCKHGDRFAELCLLLLLAACLIHGIQPLRSGVGRSRKTLR